MQNQPESPQHPQSETERDHTEKSRDAAHQGNASGAQPRSMPWPEAPVASPASVKEQAPQPAKTNPDDEWLLAFQEPEPAFPFASTSPEPTDRTPRKPTVSSHDKKPGSTSSSRREGGWAPISQSPHQTATSTDTAPPLQAKENSDSQILTPSHVQNQTEADAPSPVLTPPARQPIAAPTTNHPSTNHEDNWVTARQEQVNIPSAPPYSTNPVPPPDTTLQSVPYSPVSPPPEAQTLTLDESLLLAEVQHSPGASTPAALSPIPPFFAQPTPTSIPAETYPQNQGEVTRQGQPNVQPPTLEPYTPVPTIPPSASQSPTSTPPPISPPPGATAMPPPSEPQLTQPPGPHPVATQAPSQPLLQNQPGHWAEALPEHQRATPASTTQPTPQPLEQGTFEPSSRITPDPPIQSFSPPPSPDPALLSLDEEWVVSRDELQKESTPTVISSHPIPGPQSGTAISNPQEPTPYTPPSPLTPENRNHLPPPSDINPRSSDRHNPSAGISLKQVPFTKNPEVAEGRIPSKEAPTSPIVQSWPSSRSAKPSGKSGAAQIGVTTGQQNEADVMHGMDVGHFNPVHSGEEEYAALRLRHAVFTGDGHTLFGIFTTTTVWTILTLGLFSFWGRIHIRRYLHSQTKFGGARFVFHGTGSELLLGWMKALTGFGISYSALYYVSIRYPDVIGPWTLYGLAGVFVVCIIPIAIVGSHRYRINRTSWRSIRFSFRGSITDFTILYLKGLLLSILTLGIYYPFFEHSRRAFLISGTHFGKQAFGFDGSPRTLGQLYITAFRQLVLTLVTAEVFLLAISFVATQWRPEQIADMVFLASLAVETIAFPILIGLWFWFVAAKQRYLWNHTTFGPSRFRATMKGRQLFELRCTNLILLVGSLGLAWPWVKKRNLQFLYYHLGFKGPLQLRHILQQATSASLMSEELAGFFDTGVEG